MSVTHDDINDDDDDGGAVMRCDDTSCDGEF